jgi:ATPase family associated with various cellular activities (AAA)
MEIYLRVAWLEKLVKAGGTDFDDFRWKRPEQYGSIDLERFTAKDISLLAEIIKAAKDEGGTRAATQKINLFLKLKADPVGQKIHRLEGLAHALKEYIGKSPHKWLFADKKDEQTVPYYVLSVDYEPPDARSRTAAYVDIRLACYSHTSDYENDRRVVFHQDCLGKTAIEILNGKGFYLETPEVVAEYEKQMGIYKQFHTQTGEMFLATGYAFEADDYSRGIVSMVREGLPTKLVMDDMVGDDEFSEKKEKREVVSASFWKSTVGKRSKHDEDPEDALCAEVPIHPYVSMFDLEKHEFVYIHTSNLTPYSYDPTLIDKLVLPTERKDLVSILVTGADLHLEDIIKGKTGGIIVICTGPPGTGKTLTAEVYAEEVKRPLYGVQCSQLGVTEEELEKKLKLVLSRAARWRAILLIDEADVYVHARGNDIQQNAIVGVFLRVLEYYRGVLFMTSNRDTIIDDAILSRATAWIKYDYPEPDRLKMIWRVLSKQYGVKLTEKEIGDLVISPKLPGLSGRSVKNLLKLAKLLSLKKNESVSVELIEYVSQFIALDEKAAQAG